MAKFLVAVLAATSLSTAVAAQAHSQARPHTAPSVPLKAYEAYAPVSREEPTDMKVMGLSVPNGWRQPATVEYRSY